MSTPLDIAPASDVILTRGSAVTLEAVDWVWENWLAAGKLHLLAGQSGTGKTTIALALAATISAGGQWPDGTSLQGTPGDVIIWSGEDDIRDTLAPRLVAAGAHMHRIHIVEGMRARGRIYPFDPASHLDSLGRAISSLTNPRLIVIDPIVSAISGNSHKNAEVRRGLQPLVDLAIRHSAAVLGITHLSKGTAGLDPVERITGSLAFAALARIVMLTAKSRDENTSALMLAQSNVGPDGGGFQYKLQQDVLTTHPQIVASHVVWGTAFEESARRVMDDYESPHTSTISAIDAASSYLHGRLANGPVSAEDIRVDSEANGHSWATIRRCKEALGIRAMKSAMRGGWAWELPKALKSSEDAQPQGMSIFTTDEHLRPD